MASFKKKYYTTPVICRHNKELLKDWYVFFQFKYEGKIYKYKRRDGVNRIKDLKKKLLAINKLLIEIEIEFDLKDGWNPLLDPKRDKTYNKYLDPKIEKPTTKKYQATIEERMKRYL